MAQQRNRLKPTPETLQQLYALSGNVCAFHEDEYVCDHVLMDAKRRFVGQLCHIEAVAPGGERHNPNQTDEECRSFENLLFLCYRHHRVTNDEDAWPVEALKKMKAEHEARFAAIGSSSVSALAASEAIAKELSVRDRSKDTRLRPPESLIAFSAFFGWTEDAEERQANIDLLLPFLEAFARTPREPRQLMQVIIARGEDDNGALRVPYPELQQATELSQRDLNDLIHTLDKADLVRVDEDAPPSVYAVAFEGWGFWKQLREYAPANRLSLDDFLLDLRFDLLD
jgi:hypothetical protein